MNHYVLGFVFKGDSVLLQEAKAPWMKKRWNGIGGHIEDNETSLEAMKREAIEEVGQPFTKYDLWIPKIYMICPGGTVFIYSMKIKTFSIINFAAEREQNLRVCRVQDLPYYRMRNLDWIIPLCRYSLRQPVIVTTDDLGA
jgi:8-oxo-dGTP pyrophosphatase MutT (NUDIX family)